MKTATKKQQSKKRPDFKKRALDLNEAALYCGVQPRTMGDYYRAGLVEGSKPVGKKVFFGSV